MMKMGSRAIVALLLRLCVELDWIHVKETIGEEITEKTGRNVAFLGRANFSVSFFMYKFVQGRPVVDNDCHFHFSRFYGGFTFTISLLMVWNEEIWIIIWASFCISVSLRETGATNFPLRVSNSTGWLSLRNPTSKHGVVVVGRA